ncbi:MAG: hypothetical protein QOE55_1498 [Acidobacteriaceae bacterium]|jgi:hypothetical protein|nr:hypothetical protein [Acidobacteriaceae bacterium]
MMESFHEQMALRFERRVRQLRKAPCVFAELR